MVDRGRRVWEDSPQCCPPLGVPCPSHRTLYSLRLRIQPCFPWWQCGHATWSPGEAFLVADVGRHWSTQFLVVVDLSAPACLL